MKLYNRKIILRLLLGTALVFSSCEDSDKTIDKIFESETRGVALRTVNLISNELPIGDSSGNFSVELEIQDQKNGMLVNAVEVYIGFSDNTESIGPGTNVPESLFETISTSGFSIGEFGLPRFTYVVGLPDMLSFVGRNDGEITGGDQFTIRFELVLNDGRRFSFADNSGGLTGSFFNSPFLYTPTVVCPIPGTSFVGSYLIEQTTPFADGISFTLSSGTIVELAVGETSAARVFETENYPSFCAGTFRPFSIDLVCGQVAIPTQNAGCVCNDGTDWFTEPDVRGVYDIDDDSSFTVVFTDDTQSDCGPPVQTAYLFTKQ